MLAPNRWNDVNLDGAISFSAPRSVTLILSMVDLVKSTQSRIFATQRRYGAEAKHPKEPRQLFWLSQPGPLYRRRPAGFHQVQQAASWLRNHRLVLSTTQFVHCSAAGRPIECGGQVIFTATWSLRVARSGGGDALVDAGADVHHLHVMDLRWWSKRERRLVPRSSSGAGHKLVGRRRLPPKASSPARPVQYGRKLIYKKRLRPGSGWAGIKKCPKHGVAGPAYEAPHGAELAFGAETASEASPAKARTARCQLAESGAQEAILMCRQRAPIRTELERERE